MKGQVHNPLLGDRETVIFQNMKIVHQVANKYRISCSKKGIDIDDLVSEGLIGLMEAYEKFDGRAAFPAFAYRVVSWTILDFIRDKGATIRVSQGVYNLAGRILKENLLNSPASVVSEQLDCSIRMASEALAHLGRKMTSLDQPISSGENPIEISKEVPIIDDLSDISAKEFIERLSRRQKRILNLLMTGYSEQQIIRKLSLSRIQLERYINEIRKKAAVYFELNLSEREAVEMAVPISKDEYLRLKNNGMSDAEICQHKKIGASALYKRKKRWGVSGMKINRYGDSTDLEDLEAVEPITSEKSENLSLEWQKRAEILELENKKLWEIIDLLRSKGA